MSRPELVEQRVELGVDALDDGRGVGRHPGVGGMIGAGLLADVVAKVHPLEHVTQCRGGIALRVGPHLRLGGYDPVQFMIDYYPRIAAMHWKEAPFKYYGHTGETPTEEYHREHNLYPGMGAGGVDFLAILRLLRERGFNEWITMDYTPPREDEGTIEQQLAHNKRYLTDILGLTL